jgi:ABC-2 type transport system ATP-binding protein
MTQAPSVYGDLTVRENLRYFARVLGAQPPRVDEVIEDVALEAEAERVVDRLSGGQRARASLAAALVGKPEVVVLDEPTVGLDPDMALKVRAQIAELRARERVTILLCTHYMREAEQLCDTVAFLKRGLILAEGAPADLKRRLGLGDAIRLRITGRLPDLAGLPGLLQWTVQDGLLTCTVDEAATRLPSLLGMLAARGVRVEELKVTEPDLEDVFVEYAKPHH